MMNRSFSAATKWLLHEILSQPWEGRRSSSRPTSLSRHLNVQPIWMPRFRRNRWIPEELRILPDAFEEKLCWSRFSSFSWEMATYLMKKIGNVKHSVVKHDPGVVWGAVTTDFFQRYFRQSFHGTVVRLVGRVQVGSEWRDEASFSAYLTDLNWTAWLGFVDNRFHFCHGFFDLYLFWLEHCVGCIPQCAGGNRWYLSKNCMIKVESW